MLENIHAAADYSYDSYVELNCQSVPLTEIVSEAERRIKLRFIINRLTRKSTAIAILSLRGVFYFQKWKTNRPFPNR